MATTTADPEDAGSPLVEEALMPPGHIAVHPALPYAAGCFCVSLVGGGFILGTGPFSASIVNEGYVDGGSVSEIFDGAFQILTWGTALAAHLLGRLGPRLTAAFGLLVSLGGLGVLATLPKPASPLVVMLAYGFVGFGGNHVFLSTFQFANLFRNHVGLADGVIAGCFNLAGMMLLLLNIPGLVLKTLFSAWIGVTCVALALVLAFYPDRSYEVGGGGAFLSPPSVRHALSPLGLREYCVHLPKLCNARYGLYAFSFSLSSMIAVWLSGEFVGDLYKDAHLPAEYNNIANPIIINATILFTGLVGRAIDATGFALVGFLQAAVCSLGCILALFRASPIAAWSNLLVNNWTQSLQYTIEFVFLHKVMPADVFPAALLCTLVAQGLTLFIASPGLEPNPWGEDYLPPVVLLLCCSGLLYVWPVAEVLIFRKQEAGEPFSEAKASEAHAGMASHVASAASHIGSASQISASSAFHQASVKS